MRGKAGILSAIAFAMASEASVRSHDDFYGYGMLPRRGDNDGIGNPNPKFDKLFEDKNAFKEFVIKGHTIKATSKKHALRIAKSKGIIK